MRHTMKHALALAGALMIGTAGLANAAPVTMSTAAVKAAVLGNVTDVRWYGRGWRGGWGGPGPFFGGLAAGVIGAAVTAPYWGGYYPYGYYPYPSGSYAYAAYPYPSPYWRGYGWRNRYWRHW